MVKKIMVKPREGLESVPHPDAPGAKITGEREVQRTPGVVRFLKQGSLIEVKPTKKKTAKKAASNKPEA